MLNIIKTSQANISSYEVVWDENNNYEVKGSEKRNMEVENQEIKNDEVQTLRSIRISKNMDVLEVAEKIGVTYMYMYMIERGVRNPGDKIKRKLAKIYGISMDELYDAIDNTQSNI